jgi:formate dehydrogenase major subunit
MGDALAGSTLRGLRRVCAGLPHGRAGAGTRGPACRADKVVDSLCPFCGVGCQLSFHVKDDHICLSKAATARPTRAGCVSRAATVLTTPRHPQRLTVPLVRRADAPKNAGRRLATRQAMAQFREASWEEALALAGGGLRQIRDTNTAAALAGFGSAKGSNEEAYLFQKLVRLGFGSNNVDHCTRLCHASSVAALLEGIGSGAVSNPVLDVMQAEVVIVIGANPVVNHPVAATWIKNAVRAGTKLVLIDPRRSDLARHADPVLQFNPGSDVALLNSMMHVIVDEGLVDPRFIADRTEGFDALAANVRAFSPERMASITGIAPTRCARWRACTPAAAPA